VEHDLVLPKHAETFELKKAIPEEVRRQGGV
jgi:hypothetical protein